MKIHDIQGQGFPVTSLREIKFLKELRRHPNIIQLLEVAVGSKWENVFLIFEYCKIDLADLIRQMAYDGNYFSEREVKCLIL